MSHSLRAVFALLILLPLAGCISRDVSRSVLEGSPIDTRAFDKIEEGKSTAGWAKSLMGEPTRTIASEANTEIWEWTYRQRTSVRGQFILVSNHSTTTQRQTARVEIKDGIVINKWRDTTSLTERSQVN